MTTALNYFDGTFDDQVSSFAIDSQSDDLNSMQQDGAKSIVDLAGEYMSTTPCTNFALKARVIGRLSDIQVRDFGLGSHSAQTLDTYWMMWRELSDLAPPHFIAPVACLFAALSYERGEDALAEQSLRRALDDDPSYSLALLLRRVFSAHWPASSFTAMRSELHPKVCAAIFGE
ncbi:unannotated protein [freshwater metagenome]|uniref:Unannotated protein n=1 Tax=freshwater metagenome TaxID=449393 RepID=A0A6J7XWK7_9ZZZZ|nr:DUF4192 family protein [Actinomycetota bacterium]